MDLPFGLTVAPTCQRVPDGVDISADRASEAVHRVNSGLLSVVEPDVEFPDVFASKNASESPGGLGGFRNLVAVHICLGFRSISGGRRSNIG